MVPAWNCGDRPAPAPTSYIGRDAGLSDPILTSTNAQASVPGIMQSRFLGDSYLAQVLPLSLTCRDYVAFTHGAHLLSPLAQSLRSTL